MTGSFTKTVRVSLGEGGYDIVIRQGGLKDVKNIFDLNRKVMVVSDDTVPERYRKTVEAAGLEGYCFVFRHGEREKNLETYGKILSLMLEKGFSRHDCVVAAGGGISGDIAGFAAASYMRGIDFYNVPTTLLAQVDSSIGGKTAVNLDGFKNMVGAFHQPKKVLIDPEVLETLPKRQLANGMAEALKVACALDRELFKIFLEKDPYEEIGLIIERSLLCKKAVVEKDEKENGLRKVLNFGHTIGHGIESTVLDGTLLHGECVALGMLPMCSDGVREKLLKCLEKLGLPTVFDFDEEKVLRAAAHDKKAGKTTVSTVFVPEIGEFEFRELTLEQLGERLKLIGRHAE